MAWCDRITEKWKTENSRRMNDYSGAAGDGYCGAGVARASIARKSIIL
jgi:hypothetical protein